MPYQKLSRKSGPRRALLRGLVTSFLRTGRIETTAARAAAIRSLSEKIGPKMEGREGGYTRVIQKGPRRGDGAPMVILELVTE
jgi:large subunit ribosomal protein L17